MKRLTLLVDMDDIVVDLQPSWFAAYNRGWNDHVTPEMMTDWDVSRFAKHGKAIFEPLGWRDFFRELPEMPGAVAALRELQDEGHDVHLVSAAPNAEAHKGKVEWVFADHMPWLPKKNLWLGHRKAMLRGDVLFDDGPHNLLDYRAAWPGARIATIEHPYNRHALASCDLVAGHYTEPEAAWARFVPWVRGLVSS